MKEKLLKPHGENQIDGFVMGIVNVMRYSDPSYVFPDTHRVKPGDGVEAEWFYPALEGTLNAPSEQAAVYQYVKHSALYDDINQLCLGVAIAEMKHLDNLSDLILDLGGTIRSKWDNSAIVYGSNAKEALKANVQGEEVTIQFYSDLKAKLMKINTPTAEICVQFLSKLIADETVHLGFFTRALEAL